MTSSGSKKKQKMSFGPYSDIFPPISMKLGKAVKNGNTQILVYFGRNLPPLWHHNEDQNIQKSIFSTKINNSWTIFNETWKNYSWKTSRAFSFISFHLIQKKFLICDASLWPLGVTLGLWEISFELNEMKWRRNFDWVFSYHDAGVYDFPTGSTLSKKTVNQ